jgi:pyruvate ferredoxin oxidoreductase gamma subunit
MVEIRIHGRGGQGVVISGQLLAIAAFNEGKYAQSIPSFGVERRGAPVETYVRIEKKPIKLRTCVETPDYVLVLDPTLVSTMNVTKGLKRDGLLIINTKKFRRKFKKFKVFCVDIYSIAQEVLGRPIVNTGIIGAFIGITNLLKLDSLLKAIEETFVSKGEKIVELNCVLAKKAYQLVKK